MYSQKSTMFRNKHILADKSAITEQNPLGDAPLLNGIGKGSPFTTPDGYFDALPSLIMAKCRESGKQRLLISYGKIFPLFSPRYIFLLFLAIVSVALFVRKQNDNPMEDYQKMAAAIPDSVLLNNVQNDMAYVDVGDIENLADNQNMPLIENLPDASVPDSSNGQIINYLINNNVDATEIESNL